MSSTPPPPIVVSSDERPPLPSLRRSDTALTWEDEVREISRARARLNPADQTASRDIDFTQSKIADLNRVVVDDSDREKLADYLPNKIVFEAHNQSYDAVRQGEDGDLAYEQALRSLESPLARGQQQWQLAKAECLLELDDVEGAKKILSEVESENDPRHQRMKEIVVEKLTATKEFRGTKRSIQDELTARPAIGRRRSSTVNNDAEFTKMLQRDLARKKLDIALRAEEWDQVDKTQIELHGIDPSYFDFKVIMERFAKIRQLLNIGQIAERNATRHELNPARKRHYLEEALRTYNHGCYATELFHQHFDEPFAQVYDYDHVDCANLFFSAARVCIAFHDSAFRDGSGQPFIPQYCKVEPKLAETSWRRQALYFLEQGRSRALLDSIIRGKEFVPRLQRRLLDSAIDSVVGAAREYINMKKRDSLFPESVPASPLVQAVSPNDSPSESFRLFHGDGHRSSEPSPAFMLAMEKNKRRNTFDQSLERPLSLESEPASPPSPNVAGRSPRGSFNNDAEMKRLRIRMRWRRVKLYLFSQINPTFNAAVAALPNAGPRRFKELKSPVPDGIVVLEYGLPSSSPSGLISLVITQEGVEKATWREENSLAIRKRIRALRRLMHDDHAIVRRDAVSPTSAHSQKSVSDFGDETVYELYAKLYDYLVQPIEVLMRRLAPSRILVVPSGELAHVPWTLLLNDFRCPVSIVPSLTIWHHLHQSSLPTNVSAPNFAVFSSRPRDDEGRLRDIPFSRIEALYLSWLHGDLPTLADDVDRTVFEEQVSRSLEILHLCAHSNWDDKDPGNSSVQLFKEPWSIAQWRDLSVKAHIVVFSSCLSAISMAYDSGYTFGFAHTLLAAGTRAFIGSLWPVEDEATLLLMMLFYEELRQPSSPDAALYNAQHRLRNLDQQQLWAQVELLKAMFRKIGRDANIYVNSPRTWIRQLEEFNVLKLREPRCWAAFVLTGYGFQPIYPPRLETSIP